MSEADPQSRAARRSAVRRRRLRLGAGVAAVVVVATAVGVLALSGGHTAAVRRAKPVVTTTTTAPAPTDAGPFGIVTTKVPQLPIYPQPSTAQPPVVTLAAKTSYGLTTTLLVHGTPGTQIPPGWLPVLVPLRKPNDQTGYVQLSQVTQTQTPYIIEVNLRQHMLVVKKSGQPIMNTQVIIGTPTTQTPTGLFSLTDPLNCNTLAVPGFPLAKCSSVYGAAAIGTSGLSNQLSTFDGTIPQIALHGTDLPASDLGMDLSNGCVRMPNTAILQIAKLQPLLGTPVMITA